ncbi:ATP-binding protein [Streptomyces sp. ISL-100]|uniref:ATP-binding protein n=1 Tax=Streptomyces sp. ISL-100 TaxID=2819173 RepID=UPI001BE93495|nr:ATP-binding protein [Streptomyces sp. ISL-100]MBT2399440.1 ATP-binding protein [Streptomyces sp. ISL-100]
MPSSLRTALCPVAPSTAAALHREPRPPRPSTLAYSLTIPGEPHCAAIARTAVRSALHAHDLDPYTDIATLAASELIGTATRLSPGEDLYLSLRYRDAALRIVLWDQHPRHKDPAAITLCEERRTRSLWLLAALVEDCGGVWGSAEAHPPHRGTKSWVILPRKGIGAPVSRW